MARKKSSKNYFTKETEEYIVKYNNSTDPEYKNEIFQKHIFHPLYKLCENIIHTFKFYYTDVEKIEDLKYELISILVEDKLHKFDPTNGAKAYSYFGTIVKRWLINYNNQNFKKLKQVGSFTDIEESYEENSDLDHPSAKNLSRFIDEWVEQAYEDLDELCPKESDKKIADAILTIFATRQDLDIFRKKALYIYIREMTDCDTPHLTKVVSILKKHFYDRYQRQYDLGLLTKNPI